MAHFNPNFRPGFAEALKENYTRHCEDHSYAPKEELAKAYGRMSFKLSQKFPTIAEIQLTR